MNDKTNEKLQKLPNALPLDKAKKNCKHCYGSGICGKMYLTQTDVVCGCIIKAVAKDMKVVSDKKAGDL